MAELELRVGVNPIPRVFLFENHDQAYRIWRDAEVQQRILVHIDAHHDMWWVEDHARITIANFICPALKEDLIREVVWVVPDASWETRRNRKAVLRHIEKIKRGYPSAASPLHVEPDRISTVVLGKPLSVCPLARVPQVEESVLLDVDVDYFIIPRVSFGEYDRHGTLPWRRPAELVERLRRLAMRTDLVTIAYSVEGGYTPLRWKYLGEELAIRLQHPEHGDETLGMERIYEAALTAAQGNLPGAEERFQEASRLLPGSPAPWYHLAHLYLALGRVEDGRESYRRALTLDPSYRTAYNSSGLQCYGEKWFRAAEQEHLRTVALDPEDAYAHFGLGRLAAQKKRWSEAEGFFRKSLALNNRLTDAYRALGEVLARQGREGEAIAAYEHSLKLALAGYKPLGGPLWTANAGDCPVDWEHFGVYARLARLYAGRGASTDAINCYRMSIAGQCDGFVVRSRLAYLYLRQKQWRKSVWEAWQGVKKVPSDVGTAWNQWRRQLRLAFREGLSERLS